MPSTNAKQFPKTKYSKLSTESAYKCGGSSCSCKYVGNPPQTSQNYMNLPVLQPRAYKEGSKYIGL